MSFAIKLLVTQMDDGEGHAVLDRCVNHEVARAAGLRERIYRTVENDEEIDVAVRMGVTSGLRAEQDDPTESTAVDLLEGLASILQGRADGRGDVEVASRRHQRTEISK
jgi:hypothetical protein